MEYFQLEDEVKAILGQIDLSKPEKTQKIIRAKEKELREAYADYLNSAKFGPLNVEMSKFTERIESTPLNKKKTKAVFKWIKEATSALPEEIKSELPELSNVLTNANSPERLIALVENNRPLAKELAGIPKKEGFDDFLSLLLKDVKNAVVAVFEKISMSKTVSASFFSGIGAGFEPMEGGGGLTSLKGNLHAAGWLLVFIGLLLISGGYILWKREKKDLAKSDFQGRHFSRDSDIEMEGMANIQFVKVGGLGLFLIGTGLWLTSI